MQPWEVDWLPQHIHLMGGGTWWWPELVVVTPCKEVWPYSLTTAICHFSFLMFSYHKKISQSAQAAWIHHCHHQKSEAASFILSFCLWNPHLTLWSPSLPSSSCLDSESMKAEWWLGPLFPELYVGSSRSGGAPSGWSTGQDIYQQLPRLTRGSARSVMELSCLFNPRHMRVTRANPVGRQKPCCVFVEQLLGSWCTAVAGLVWKWRVTWSFNLFFFSLIRLFFFSPPQTDIADNNCFWRVPVC